MRREAMSLKSVDQVVTIIEDGVTKEPVEDLMIEIAPEFVGVISQEWACVVQNLSDKNRSAVAPRAWNTPSRRGR